MYTGAQKFPRSEWGGAILFVETLLFILFSYSGGKKFRDDRVLRVVWYVALRIVGENAPVIAHFKAIRTFIQEIWSSLPQN